MLAGTIIEKLALISLKWLRIVSIWLWCQSSVDMLAGRFIEKLAPDQFEMVAEKDRFDMAVAPIGFAHRSVYGVRLAVFRLRWDVLESACTGEP